MIKKTTIILCVLFAGLCVQAQTIKKEQVNEVALPEGNLVRVHVSGGNGEAAALLQRPDGYWIYINRELYGPFEDTDVLNSSPFNTTNHNWQFRGAQGGRQVLVVNGVRYGDFDHIWTPNFSRDGAHWGSLVKNGARYAMVIDGVTTNFFDVIFYEGQGQAAGDVLTLNAHSRSTAPYFYGSRDRWVAIGYREAEPAADRAAEFRVLTENGEGSIYDQVEKQSSMITDPNNSEGDFGYIQYERHITLDGESAVVSVHLPNLPSEDNHLWINRTIYGPYPEGLTTFDDGFHAYEAMAADGSNWVIKGRWETAYTRDEVLPYLIYGNPAMSRSGRSFSFNFRRDLQEYIYVNGREFGPFSWTMVASFSPSGDHWAAGGAGENQWFHLTTESGITYGPYGSTPSVVYRDENTWTGYGHDENQNGYALVNGTRTAGPFQVVSPQAASPASCFVGVQGSQASLIVDGQIRFQQTGVRLSAPGIFVASKGATHWAMTLLQLDGTVSFIDNGRVVSGLTVAQRRKVFSSENYERNALLLYYANEGEFIVANGAKYGPYQSVGNVVLSAVGQAWAAISGDEEDGQQLILPGVTPVGYSEILEMKAVGGEDAVIYNGFKDNRWFPGINNISLGTFSQASINCGSSGSNTIYLATNEGDRLLKTYKVSIER